LVKERDPEPRVGYRGRMERHRGVFYGLTGQRRRMCAVLVVC